MNKYKKEIRMIGKFRAKKYFFHKQIQHLYKRSRILLCIDFIPGYHKFLCLSAIIVWFLQNFIGILPN